MCDYIRREIKSDAEPFADGAFHVMALYGARVDDQFKRFMGTLFGDQFKHAPVKKTKRMREKLLNDATLMGKAAWTRGGTCSEPICTSPYDLCDVVRGSVTVAGPERMLAVIAQLRTHVDDQGRCFDTWRIKNTHRPEAQIPGETHDFYENGSLFVGVCFAFV